MYEHAIQMKDSGGLQYLKCLLRTISSQFLQTEPQVYKVCVGHPNNTQFITDCSNLFDGDWRELSDY